VSRRRRSSKATATGTASSRNGSTAPSAVNTQPSVAANACQPSRRPPTKPARSGGGAGAAARSAVSRSVIVA